MTSSTTSCCWRARRQDRVPDQRPHRLPARKQFLPNPQATRRHQCGSAERHSHIFHRQHRPQRLLLRGRKIRRRTRQGSDARRDVRGSLGAETDSPAVSDRVFPRQRTDRAVWQQTPDNRPGWAYYLINQGYVVVYGRLPGARPLAHTCRSGRQTGDSHGAGPGADLDRRRCLPAEIFRA